MLNEFDIYKLESNVWVDPLIKMIDMLRGKLIAAWNPKGKGCLVEPSENQCLNSKGVNHIFTIIKIRALPPSYNTPLICEAAIPHVCGHRRRNRGSRQ